MIFLDRYKILKNYISVCDYDYVLNEIEKYITAKKNLLVSPIASQTLVKAYFDDNLRKILDKYDGLYPDSQWVKRAIYFLYGVELKDRVYGPELMLKVCELARKNKYNIFLYGTTEKTLRLLIKNLQRRYTDIKITGLLPSEFRELDNEEKKDLIRHIEQSKADILMIGLGSPLEQIIAYQLMCEEPKIKKSMIVIPFGAAFDFIAGVKPQALKWMRDRGLEWFFRLISEPGRLWQRYLILGPLFIFLVIWQKLSLLFDFSNHKVGKDKIGS